MLRLESVSGTLREKYPGIWQVRFEAGRDPLTGRRRQSSRNVHGSKRQAQQALNALVAAAQAGRSVGTLGTFGQLSTRWLAHVEHDLSPTTLRRYKNLLSKRILPALGDRPVSSIQAMDLDDLYQGLARRVGLSSATIRQAHAIIRRAMRQAVLWSWISTNPAANATPPRLTKSDLSPPDPDQIGELLRAANDRDPEFARFLHIAATTGARRGELCALRWSNLEVKAGTLTIERSVVEVRGGLLEKDTKTHANRRIALDDDTLAVFDEQYDFAWERASLIGQSPNHDAFVFSREPDGSTPWTPDSVTKRFAIVREELGYDNMRLHDLRHFAATRLIAAGVPVRTVSGRLGHANPSTTLSVYSHFVEASDQEAASVVGKLVSSSKSRSAVKSASPTPARKVAASARNRR
ncbi:MAG: tyrosine-type recombinase/integrase [Acidimicrobiales bacterium]